MANRRSRPLLILLALAIALTPLAYPATTAALSPVTVGRSVFHVIKGMVRRGQIYGDLERARRETNEQLDQMKVTALQHSRRVAFAGDDEAIARQSAFLQAELTRIRETKNAVTEVTENLKKMTKRTFDNKLGETVLNAMLKQVSGTQGFQRVSSGLTSAFTNTGNAFDRVIGAIQGGDGDILNRIAAVREDLQKAAALSGFLGGKIGRDMADRLSRLDGILSRATGRLDEAKEEILGELAEGRETLDSLQADYDTAIANIKDWQPSGFGLDRRAMSASQRTSIDAIMGALNTQRAGTVVKELATAGAMMARTRVGEMAAIMGIALSEDQATEIAIRVGIRIIEEYKRRGGVGAVDVDAMIREILTEMFGDDKSLAEPEPEESPGVLPSPTPEPTPTPTPSPTPAPEPTPDPFAERVKWDGPECVGEVAFLEWTVTIWREDDGGLAGTLSFHECTGGRTAGLANYSLEGLDEADGVGTFLGTKTSRTLNSFDQASPEEEIFVIPLDGVSAPEPNLGGAP
jgi:hypothetical protein